MACFYSRALNDVLKLQCTYPLSLVSAGFTACYFLCIHMPNLILCKFNTSVFSICILTRTESFIQLIVASQVGINICYQQGLKFKINDFHRFALS